MEEEMNTGFDAANFLDNYREDAAPNIRKSKKKADASSNADTSKASDEKPKEPLTPSERRNALKKEVVTVDDTFARPNISPEEKSYLDEYLTERICPGFARQGKQTPIAIEFHTKINALRVLHGKGITVGGYVNNILADHFKKFEDVINSLMVKSSKM